MKREAIISDCGIYRYWLMRQWDDKADSICFVMLNPSTADAYVDDRTIIRCIDFAQQWKYGRLEVVNLFALRSTNRAELKKAVDPVGTHNDSYLIKTASNCKQVIAAWGEDGILQQRSRTVLNLLRNNSIQPYYLKMGKYEPFHPLYVPKTATPIPFAMG